MPAANNKLTAVHFSLMAFVMISLIMGAMAYMSNTSYTEEFAKSQKLTTENQTLQNATRKQLDEIQTLKNVIGSQMPEVGELNSADANTVTNAVASSLSKNAGATASNNALEGLTKLRSALDQMTQERNQLQAEVNRLKEENLALNSRYQAQVDLAQTKASEAEAASRTNISDKEEQVAAKEKKNEELVADRNRIDTEYRQYKEAAEKQIGELQNDKKRLFAINDRLRQKVNDATRESFDRPNGELRYVDYNNKLVWVNIGEADGLPVGTTFSVYSRGVNGLGRGPEDVKGAIEITKVLEAHLAEARIIKDDPAQPMAPQDPIFTPIWAAGRKLSVAVAGFIDIDQDGQNDRDAFHEFLSAANCILDLEIDDAGEVVGPGITANTKYLVMAPLPDPTKVAHNDKEATDKILRETKKLEEQARLLGIRTVTLNDFLTKMGYVPQRRNFRPGDKMPFTLRNGSASAAAGETIGNREAAGTVSGIYKNTKRVGPAATSSGQTSKAYKSGGPTK